MANTTFGMASTSTFSVSMTHLARFYTTQISVTSQKNFYPLVISAKKQKLSYMQNVHIPMEKNMTADTHLQSSKWLRKISVTKVRKTSNVVSFHKLILAKALLLYE